jgi:hypothetical protein
MKLMINATQFKVKPTSKDAQEMTHQFKTVNIDLNRLEEEILKGKTIRPSILKGTRESDWMSQQVFMIDIDGTMKIEDAIDKYKYLNPSMIYTSFSHTEESHKFRLIFISKDNITDFNLAKRIQLGLMDKIKECDEKCKNINRFYYAGYSVVYKRENKFIDIDSIVNGISYSESEPSNLSYTNAHSSNSLKSTLSIINNITDIVHLNKNSTKPSEFNVLDYYDYIYHYDMRDILDKCITNVSDRINDSVFRCILPKHKDSNPSAGILITDDGTYIYNCFGCGKSLNNITLIEEIYRCDRYRALKILNSILNIKKADNEFIAEQKEKIDVNIEYIMTGQLEKDFPDIYKFLKRDIGNLVCLYEFAKMKIYDERYQIDDNAIFFASLESLQKLVFKQSKSTSNKTMQLFNLLETIVKVDPNLLPESVKEIAEKHKKNDRVTNHFYVNPLSNEKLENINESITVLKENNYTKKAMSREYVLRTFGMDMANKLYPQDSDKQNTKKSNSMTQRIVDIIFNMIELKGYFTEKDLITHIKRGKERSKLQFKISVEEICQSYDLSYVKATKDNLLKYGITDKIHHNAKIIVKNIE